ncbi:MAG: RNA chaperone Hfq [Pseudomonadota bacterium]|nr:RNA chaperone Hfq [Pseudomonadota bacterium]
MTENKQNVQEIFLNHLRKHKMPATIYLTNGVQLKGVITWFDHSSLLLRREAHAQLVYKHAISTVMPGGPIQVLEGAEGELALGQGNSGSASAP